MSDDVLVKVDNVSKRFCRSLKRSLWYGLQDLGSEIGGRRHGGGSGLPQSSADVQLRPDEFWAVKDVSFELRRGECLGLIGRNGAGKTTLLRMLNGLIKPDTGRITIKGRVGALIALGAGFNPILTGRENIQVNASVLGFSRAQTDDLADQIIDFSGIHEFIDTPVQSYSSGMQVRLGFSIAVHQQPDLLILDEVLAVGDKPFRVKCLNKLLEIKKTCSVVFVSHASEQLGRICDQGVVLYKGVSVVGAEDIAQALLRYESADTESTWTPESFSSNGASIEIQQCTQGNNLEVNTIVLPIKCSNRTNQALDFHVVIRRSSSLEVVTESYIKAAASSNADNQIYELTYNSANFAPGKYVVSASLCTGSDRHVLAFHINGTPFDVIETENRLKGPHAFIQNLHGSFSPQPLAIHSK